MFGNRHAETSCLMKEGKGMTFDRLQPVVKALVKSVYVLGGALVERDAELAEKLVPQRLGTAFGLRCDFVC
ncbi:hypothetical protein GCM10016234_38340 [Tianweitania populi]|uniref:Uncharacterized protein n=1 Tax=Tianweitania populi TaxID=1607949 RepID=A0A8J3E0I8_9HYPH|nr:hypothetical protein GCM10016234_38340 [Tianweitania populi]